MKNNCSDCYNVVYNSVPTMLFDEKQELKDYGVLNFRLAFTIETKEETKAVFDCYENKKREIAYTKGHYKRGVE